MGVMGRHNVGGPAAGHLIAAATVLGGDTMQQQQQHFGQRGYGQTQCGWAYMSPRSSGRSCLQWQ
jgi:hypothetical protein